MKRVLTAAVLLPLLWLAIKRAPPWLFFAAASGVLAVAVWECYRLLEARGSRPFKAAGVLTSLAVAGSFVWGAYSPALPLVLATIGITAAAMGTRGEPREMLDASMSTLFPVLFVGLALAYALALRALPGEDGTDVILLLFTCVMAADTAAYYVGSRFGRRRVAPTLSPGKTWEGVVAGLGGSVLGGLLAHVWFYQRLPLRHAVTVGVLLGVSSVAGDLAESMVKRAANAKDSSTLLPGHGGLLDRTDSLLFAGPVLYYYYMRFLGTDG